MRIGLTVVVAAALGLAVVQWPVRADDKGGFKDEREKASYGLGVYWGTQLKRNNMDLDLEVLVSALKDTVAGHELKLTDQQASEALRTYQQDMRKKTAEKNKKEGEEFLAGNKTKPGVQSHEVKLHDGSSAEMQYRILTEGNGPVPKSNDTVTVNYRGTLLNGKEFDSSYKRGQPGKFMVNRVVRGWSEALQMMKVGSKWDLYIPAALAYGDNGTPSIEPGSTLTFEVELLGIEPPQAPPSPQPLTSDIIKVPSAEELKKGAKIEVIKPEDAAKIAQQQQEQQKKQQADPAKPDQK